MKRWILALVLLVVGAAHAQSQFLFKGEGTGKNAILEKLGGPDGKGLRMGWFIPPNRLILDAQFPQVTVYTGFLYAATAQFTGPLDKAGLDLVRKQYCMPCGEPGGTQDQFYEYHVQSDGLKSAQRVLVSPAAFPDAFPGAVDSRSTKLIWPKFMAGKCGKLLGLQKGQLHRSFCFRTPNGQFTFSFHAFYDPKTKNLKRSGMVVQKRGVVIASEASDFDPAKNCDGCVVPTYEGSLEAVFQPINLIETSVLPCPILLEDTSTAEGKALSLVTYDLDGVKSEVRAYEYVVNCCPK